MNIPWWSVTYSDGMEKIFVSWKLIATVIVSIPILYGILRLMGKSGDKWN